MYFQILCSGPIDWFDPSYNNTTGGGAKMAEE